HTALFRSSRPPAISTRRVSSGRRGRLTRAPPPPPLRSGRACCSSPTTSSPPDLPLAAVALHPCSLWCGRDGDLEQATEEERGSGGTCRPHGCRSTSHPRPLGEDHETRGWSRPGVAGRSTGHG